MTVLILLELKEKRMAEDKIINQSNREQFQFYSTFDGEIVQIDENSSPNPSIPGGPRISSPPVPVIPGSCSLSEAIVKAKQRREAELRRELEQGDRFDDNDLSLELMPDLTETRDPAGYKSGDPLITAVSPGHFQRRTGSGPSRRTLREADADTVLEKTLLAIFEEGAPKKTGNLS